jgi:hypothetical protein
MTLLVRDHTLLYSYSIDPFTQLRKPANGPGGFSNFALTRVVRVTIETNMLTGTYLSKLHTDVHLTSCFSWCGYHVSRALCRISRKSNELR